MDSDGHAITLTEETYFSIHAVQFLVAVELIGSDFTDCYVSSGYKALVILGNVFHGCLVDAFRQVIEVSLVAFFFFDSGTIHYQTVLDLTGQRLVLLKVFGFKVYGHGITPIGFGWLIGV